MVVVVAGFFVTNWLGRESDGRMRANILSHSLLVAASLETDHVIGLTGLASDLEGPDYGPMRNELLRMQSAGQEFRSLYYMTLRDGNVLFAVDSVTAGAFGHVEPGGGPPYEQPPLELLDAFATGTPRTVGPYTDEWGTFISGFVPILNDGRVAGVLGIDVDAREWRAAVAASRLRGTGVTMVIALILLGFFVVRDRLADDAQRLSDSERGLAEAQRIARIGSFSGHVATGEMVWSGVMYDITGLRGRTSAPMFDDFVALVHPSDREAAAAVLRGERDDAELRILPPDGGERRVVVQTEMQRDASGAPAYVSGVVQDVTERKRAEDEIAAWQVRYRLVTAASGQVVFERNLDTGEILWGEGVERVLGHSPDDMRGGVARWAEGVHPEDRDAAMHRLAEAVRDRGRYDVEYRFLTSGGDYRWIHDRADFLGAARDDGRRMIGTMQDVTAQVLAQEATRQAHQELQKANLMKSQFLANMSHEIRTPLNAIIGFTDLLLDTELSEEQRDFTQTIGGSGQVLLVLINDILDLSKIEAEKLELESAPFVLSTCVEEAFDLIASKAGDKHLDLAFMIDRDLPSTFTGDVTRLRQVLVNLLSNAVKFTDEGEVVVTVSGELVDADRFRLHFTVRDTGQGIPPERQDCLFKAFTQVDASTTRRFGGTGLGLAISKRLSELMGGAMWVESSGVPGKGAAFHFTIVVPAARGRGVGSAPPGGTGR